MTHPSSLLAIAVLAGVVIGSLAPSLCAWAVVPAMVAAWIGVGLGFGRRSRALGSIALTIGFVTFGLWAGAREVRRAEAPPLTRLFDRRAAEGRDGSPVVVVGRLRRDAAETPYGATLSLAVEQVIEAGRPRSTPGGLRVSVGGTQVPAHVAAWRAGRRVRLPVTLRRPERYLNPGVADQERRFARLGTALRGSVKSALVVEVVESGTRPAEWAATARAWIRRAIARDVGRVSARSGGIVIAILIGDRSGLDPDTQRRLRKAGTYHVIAISGGNIAILGALVLVALRLLRCGTRVASVGTAATLGGYAYLVGSDASVVRATIGAAVFLAARAADHRTPPLNALALVAAIMLVATPLTIFDAGFALTFGATLAILIGVPRIYEAWCRWMPDATGRAWGGVRAVVLLGAATVCAEAALFPISAYAFSRISVAGLVLNFAAIPLMSVVQVAGMVVVAASAAWPALAAVAGLVAHGAATGLVESAALVEWMPWASQRVPPPPVALLAVYYGGWIVWLSARRIPRLRWAAAGVTAAAAALVIVAPVWPTPGPLSRWRPANLRVTFLDVGQGDATVVQLPDRSSLLVDAGGIPGSTFDMGERVVVPALWALGLRRLDWLLLSHGHPDHLGGGAAALRDLRPREIWEGVPVGGYAPLGELRRLAAAERTAWRTVQSGDRVRAGGLELRVWHPPAPDWERPRVRNDDSVVLEVRWGDVSVLLPGDIGAEVERDLTTGAAQAALQVVKVPHHGSAGSSSARFVEAWRPDVVIVSAGRANRFGHPAPDVVRRYLDAGAAVFNTADEGAITLVTDGHTIDIRTMRGRTLRLKANR